MGIINGTLPTRTKHDDRMSNDLLSNYEQSVFTNANRKARAPKYISTGCNLLSQLFSGSAMLKVLRSLRAKTSRILSIQLSLSALRFALFLMCRPLAKNSESTTTFFFSRAQYIPQKADKDTIYWMVLSKSAMMGNALVQRHIHATRVKKVQVERSCRVEKLRTSQPANAVGRCVTSTRSFQRDFCRSFKPLQRRTVNPYLSQNQLIVSLRNKTSSSMSLHDKIYLKKISPSGHKTRFQRKFFFFHFYALNDIVNIYILTIINY